MKQIFCSEFTNVPECLYDTKKQAPFHGSKSQLIPLLAKNNNVCSEKISTEGLVVDLSTVTRSLGSVFQKRMATFEEFVSAVLDHIWSMANAICAKRIDIVADFYDPASIKGPTRKDRGSLLSQKIAFEPSSQIPEDMELFLKNSENKRNLNEMIANYVVHPLRSENYNVVATHREAKVLTSYDGPKDLSIWQPETHEEADNRLLLHMRDMLLNGSIQKILVRSVDTDVLVILLAFMPQLLEFKEDVHVWLDFGRGENRKLYDVNMIFREFGESLYLGLPFFHSFTGCDSTSSFFEKSKGSFFNHWQGYDKFDEITCTFQQLCWLPSLETLTATTDALDRFVATLYVKSGSNILVNDARYQLYVHSASDNLRKLPPSRDGLKEHIKRSAFQAGWVWRNKLSNRLPPSKFDWGWKQLPERDDILIQWTSPLSLPKISITQVTSTCRCKSEGTKCGNCKCGKHNMICLLYCLCKRSCIS